MSSPMLSAAILSSRIAMNARPEREFTRLKTIISEIISKINPAGNVAIFCIPLIPIGPRIISLPPFSSLVVSVSILK